jgi:phage FluMu protein Com
MTNKLLINGKCPRCKTRIKIDSEKYSIFKSKPVWIYKFEDKVELKCPKCKEIIVDKK